GGEKKAAEEDSAPVNPVLLVSAARAEVHPMSSEIHLLGKTVATHHVIIRAPTAGRVVGMKLTTGDSVRKGQVVAHVVNREIEAAEAGLAVARKIDPADAPSLSASVGRYDRSRSGGIPVIAPDAGIVAQPPVTSGEMVADLDTLVDLIDPASLYVDTSVPMSQLSLVRPGMAATVTTPFRPGVEFPARIDAILPNFDTASGTSSVRTNFTGTERIAEAGAPVEVRIETANVPDAIVVPAAALFQDQGADQYHVFVVGADGKAHRTNVKVGLRDRDRVQVTDGIKVGDLVITSGGYALSDGLGVRVAQGNQ
ncbi:MAG TPA: efflux RND transporter periplasmic adaptor subunit, partial [Candidatus Sulfotelmatobacter sp.]|nr:efflux RND transporter periplasmic adaptor subunit [Candidatus Sulfotelmatobacter sp.]